MYIFVHFSVHVCVRVCVGVHRDIVRHEHVCVCVCVCYVVQYPYQGTLYMYPVHMYATTAWTVTSKMEINCNDEFIIIHVHHMKAFQT